MHQMIKNTIFSLLLLVWGTLALQAQERTVENRPYTDLRPFHFGLLVGAHLQDIELNNVGYTTVTNSDGTTSQSLVTADQDRWDQGFTVGVLGELRLNTTFQFRIAPTMYFGTRHITFHNFTQQDNTGKPVEQRQELKTVYISSALDLICAARRFNNHRPYLVVGLNPMINLRGSNHDYLALKRYDCYAEIGAGCDFYLEFFKIRPEIKFMYGLTNCIDMDHVSRLQDRAQLPYAQAVNKGRAKIIALTFYFE